MLVSPNCLIAVTWVTFQVLASPRTIDLLFCVRARRNSRPKRVCKLCSGPRPSPIQTAIGATAVQIMWSWRRGSCSIEHIGSAHDEVELAALRTAAVARLPAGHAGDDYE